jgi:hypothetical protein
MIWFRKAWSGAAGVRKNGRVESPKALLFTTARTESHGVENFPAL